MNSMEKAFDTLLDETAKQVDEELGNSMDIPTEEINYSKEHKAKMGKMFKQQRKKDNPFNYGAFARRAAIILLALSIGSFAAMSCVEAWRIKILNFVFEPEQPNTDYSFSDADKGETYSDDNLILKYVPMGYEVEKNTQTSRSLLLQFSNGDNYFRCSIKDAKLNSEIDRDNATVEKTEIDGLPAEVVITPSIVTVLWKDDVRTYAVSGNIPKDELIKIAQDMVVLK